MLNQPTLDKLRQMGLHGMLEELRRQSEQPGHYSSLSFEERLGHLVEQEWLARENKRLTARLRHAKLKQQACVEDIDYKHDRGLDKAHVRQLARCEWVAEKRNLLITGPTGVGKSYLASALANQACRQGFTVSYSRLARLITDLAAAREEGTENRLLKRLAKVNVLVIDDFGLVALGTRERHWLLEIAEERYDVGPIVITSQLPVTDWYGYIGDATMADAILDRVVKRSARVEFKPNAESIRGQEGRLKKKRDEE
jgi:DNA replication protein DnaC